MMEKRYIGDGVEVSYDGYHIWLKTVDGNNQQIALEPAVYGKLLLYVEDLKNHLKEKQKEDVDVPVG